MYKAILKPILSYGVHLWGLCQVVQHDNQTMSTIKNTKNGIQRTTVRKQQNPP